MIAKRFALPLLVALCLALCSCSLLGWGKAGGQATIMIVVTRPGQGAIGGRAASLSGSSSIYPTSRSTSSGSRPRIWIPSN